eukprot:GHVS01020353.1.p1 GENE.GHVS01020353.1~~GHVS01020353.1.p1  ORF type:complete len:272 (+),score=22.69 GHVS01020353.1:103-918(+)
MSPSATVSYLDYPIYSIGSDGKHVLTSGGGGGADYGIEDQLEVHSYDPLEQSLSHLGCHSDLVKGVVDSIVYSPQSKLWACCLKSYCLVFKLDDETAEPRILQKVQTDFTEPEGRQTVVRFSPSGELLITGGDEKTLRVWRLESEAADPSGRMTGRNAMQLLSELRGHTGDVKDCAITADSLTVAHTMSWVHPSRGGMYMATCVRTTGWPVSVVPTGGYLCVRQYIQTVGYKNRPIAAFTSESQLTGPLGLPQVVADRSQSIRYVWCTRYV